MAEEVLKEVLIKELHESGIDQVFYVQNLPKRFIYKKVPKMIQRYDRDGYTDGTVIPDPEGEMVDGLLDGLELSQNGDEAVTFPMGRETAKNAIRAIDAYISGTLPRDIQTPRRIPYPLDPTDSRSAPKPKSMIPVVELSVSKAALPEVSPELKDSPLESAPLKKRRLTEEQRIAARERLARAREIKKAQLINKANAPQGNV